MKKSQNLFSNDRFHRVPHCRFPVFPPTGSWEAQHGVWRFSRWSWRADWQMLDSDAGRDWGQEEKGTRGWDGWMASPTRWTWVWVNSGSWWWTGRPGMLQFMGSQRVGHNWATELNWTELGNWMAQRVNLQKILCILILWMLWRKSRCGIPYYISFTHPFNNI